MSYTKTYAVPHVSDADLVDKLPKLLEALDTKQYAVQVHSPAPKSFDLRQTTAESIVATLADVVALDADLIDTLQLIPHTQNQHPAWTYQRAASTVAIQFSGGFDAGTRVLKVTLDHFERMSDLAVRKHFSEADRMHLEQLERATVKLNDVARQALDDSNRFRSQVERRYEQRAAALEHEHADQKKRLEDEHAQRTARLDEAEKQLESRKQALDDREAIHARRALHSKLKERISERAKTPALSKETARKRSVVHVACIVLLLLLAAVSLGGSDALLDLATDSDSVDAVDHWARLVKRVLAGLGFGALAWYYVRFVSDWFKQHAEDEAHLRQLELDLDRSSWLVEVTREWAEAKIEPPEHLLEAVSRGLFVPPRRGTPDEHPLMSLASHLERAEKARLKFGENEVEVGSRALSAKKPPGA